MSAANRANHSTSEPPARGTDPAVRFFDSSAKDYESKYYEEAVRSFMTVRQRRVLELVDALHLPRGARVLDAGCGPGYLVEALGARGFRVWALDAVGAMLESARARLTRAQPDFPASFKRASIERLPYRNESFDLVVSTGVIEYLETDAIALASFPGCSVLVAMRSCPSPTAARRSTGSTS